MAKKRTRSAEEAATTVIDPSQAEHIPTPEGPVHQPEQIGAAVEQVLEQATQAQEQHQRRPVREMVTSTLTGVRAVEDKRFKLARAGIDFADDKRATPDEKAELKEAGFQYEPRDKGYTAIATPESREARDRLATSFIERRKKEMEQAGEQGVGR